MSYKLSILIPARNEMFLSRTIQDMLEHMEGDTEIIVGLDGAWAEPAIPDHDRVKILYYAESIGQRAMTNQLARLSDAKYVMKADAHTAWDQGFDVKMMKAFEELGDNVTMVPIMRNLHAFDWVCEDGHRRYQSPSGACTTCNKPTTRDVVWFPKPSPQSTSYCFDPDPHFQYFNDYKKRQHGELVETMSLQGSCFMMTREKYWELNICDEAFGSWGSQGIEVAVKTWLSGGRVIVNKRTWYAHMFRTQGGDFSFPYFLKQSKVNEAKRKARELFFNQKWDKAIYPLSWLIERFWPVFMWTDEDLRKLKENEKPKKGIIYYTDNRLNLKIAHKVQDQLSKISREKGIPIVSASLKPMNFGKNIHVNMKRGYEAYFTQILKALEASTAEIIYFCEHDNLYHPSHFDFIPPEKETFYYDHNWWKVRDDGFAVHWDADQVSGLCVYRETALKYYRERLEKMKKEKFNGRYEPMSRSSSKSWWAPYPSIDIRHNQNLTYNKWSLADFRDKSTAVNFTESTVDQIAGWDNLQWLMKQPSQQ